MNTPDTRCPQCREQDESCLFGEGDSCPYRMTTEETIAFLEGHEDEAWELAKQLADVVSYELGPQKNALRMMRLIGPVVMDKIRLDWLERQGKPETFEDAANALVWTVVGDPGCRVIREAIDQARKETP